MTIYSREFTTLKGIYDGGNVIAEYDDTGSLAKKYIHGARVDELLCMIDVAGSSAVYYYHYNGLGSVVALSDSDGDSCQSYEYSAYGRVWAEYPEFKANPYMFTGRRFDYETGLYYYRARYYNPYIGRFLQTDPVGYGDGMNLYAYCRNNPSVLTDPFGCVSDAETVSGCIYVPTMDRWVWLKGEYSIEDLCYMYHCHPSELLSYTIQDLTIWVEIDIPSKIYQADPSAKWVDAEWFTSSERIIIEEIIEIVITNTEIWYVDNCYGREVDDFYPWGELLGPKKEGKDASGGITGAFIDAIITVVSTGKEFKPSIPLPYESWEGIDPTDDSTYIMQGFWYPVLYDYAWVYYWTGKLGHGISFGDENLDNFFSYFPGIHHP